MMSAETTGPSDDSRKPRRHGKNAGPVFGGAWGRLMDYHSKLERRFAKQLRRKHPDMFDHEVEGLAAMRIYQEFQAHPERFLAKLRRPKSRC